MLIDCSQVHLILLSVVLDKQEAKQMRAAAFMVLKKTHPSFTTLQTIAHSLRTEQSRQIKTLIFTSLVNLAKVKSDITEIRSTYVHVPRCCFLPVSRRILFLYLLRLSVCRHTVCSVVNGLIPRRHSYCR